MPALDGFPEALRRLRLKRGFATLALAQDATGVFASNLSRYETGGAKPDFGTVERILDGYKATLMDLAREIEAPGEDDYERAKARIFEIVDRDVLKGVVREVLKEEGRETQCKDAKD